MSTSIQRFQLSQGGKNYILTTKIEGNYVILTCVQAKVSNSPIYFGQFTLTQLRQLSKMFNTMTTISQAQEFLNQSIENQKVSVEHQGNLININFISINFYKLTPLYLFTAEINPLGFMK